MVASISFTFDDGRSCQVTPASRVLDEFGMNGTFYVCPGLAREERWGWRPGNTVYELASWEEIVDAGARGHEIGNHSWSHPDLRTVTRGKKPKWLSEFAQREIVAPAEEINKRIPEQGKCSWAWPCHGVAEPVFEWIDEYHVGARPTTSRCSYSGKQRELEHLRKANAFADILAKTNRWGVAIIHDIGEGKWKFSYDIFRRHLEYVSKVRGLEVKTVMEVFSGARS